MKKSNWLKGFSTFFSIIGVLLVGSMIILFVTNASSLGTFFSVLGIVKTDSLHDTNSSELIQGATAGIVESLDDPYSKYLDKDTWQELKIRLEAQFGGIGVYVSQDEQGRLKVVSPIKATPAFKAGVKHGDIIIGINGESTTNMTQDEAASLMRGDPGTQLVLTVFRESEEKELDFKIVREIINVPSVEDQILEDHPQIGYIRLNQFHTHSTEEMAESVKRLVDKEGVQGLILDLRFNGGGDFDASISIAGIFLDGDAVVSAVNRKGTEKVYRASAGKTDIPLVVLVNSDSASASEILAGALQDNKRALLVGEKTFGKGLVQTVYPLNDGGALKLTTQKYFTPNGTDINEIGINPEHEVEITAEDTEDLQLKKAIEVMKSQIF
ncbi:MAG TPA: S41 family peptidase [Syntrophomonadaceae bacterium]|nr:S41 family peptidase [Syntrophomonadaceae bacterium]